jgi:ParB family chromosome partitioning protein
VAIRLPSFLCWSINQTSKGEQSMSLSPSTSNNATQDAVQVLRDLPVDAIIPNPSQARSRFDEAELQELAGSLGERGVLQPVLVRPLGEQGMYQLVAGERRWRAAKIAGLQTIPALVSRYHDRASLEVGLIENMARRDLNPVEEARACATLVKELGLTQGQVGRLVGRDSAVVSSLICLLELSEEILAMLERGELSTGHGVALRRVKDLDARLPLARAAIEQGWTVRTLEARVRASNVALLESQHRDEQVRDPEQEGDSEQAQDLAALSLARVWGDLLGAEVHVRPMRQQLRMEVVFDLAADGVALAERLASVVSRGSKGS